MELRNDLKYICTFM